MSREKGKASPDSVVGRDIQGREIEGERPDREEKSGCFIGCDMIY